MGEKWSPRISWTLFFFHSWKKPESKKFLDGKCSRYSFLQVFRTEKLYAAPQHHDSPASYHPVPLAESKSSFRFLASNFGYFKQILALACIFNKKKNNMSKGPLRELQFQKYFTGLLFITRRGAYSVVLVDFVHKCHIETS